VALLSLISIVGHAKADSSTAPDPDQSTPLVGTISSTPSSDSAGVLPDKVGTETGDERPVAMPTNTQKPSQLNVGEGYKGIPWGTDINDFSKFINVPNESICYPLKSMGGGSEGNDRLTELFSYPGYYSDNFKELNSIQIEGTEYVFYKNKLSGVHFSGQCKSNWLKINNYQYVNTLKSENKRYYIKNNNYLGKYIYTMKEYKKGNGRIFNINRIFEDVDPGSKESIFGHDSTVVTTIEFIRLIRMDIQKFNADVKRKDNAIKEEEENSYKSKLP